MRTFPILGCLLSLALGACMQTSYRTMGSTTADDPLLERRVDYRLDPAFFAAAPHCAALRTSGPMPPDIGPLVESSVERHLGTRLHRVISAARLRQVETALGIDIAVASDQRVFARQARCQVLVDISLDEINDDYVVLWAQRGLGLTLTMTRISDDKVLWTARHRASRSDGGLPISVLSLPFSAARAAYLKNDPDLFASIADDAVRRMMKTLPDIRGTGLASGSLGARY